MKKDIITSPSNRFVKHVVGLQHKKERKEHRQFVVEGIRILKEYLGKDVEIDYVLYSNKLEGLKGGHELLQQIQGKCRCYEVSEAIMAKISGTENPQGIITVINIAITDLNSLALHGDAFLLILDRIQDPGNMGTIIRTAVAAGVEAIILTKGCVDPYNSKTVRAAMGALLTIPIIEAEENKLWMNKLKDNGVILIGSSLDTAYSYLDIDYRGKIAIAIGNEANGIDEELLQQMDSLVNIPIIGNIESLNASIAAGILLYKAVEARGRSI